MMMSFNEKINKLMNCVPAGVDPDNGVHIWMVKGGDNNPDFGGSHTLPLIGFVEATYAKAVRWAVKQPHFDSWSLGEVTLVDVINISELPEIKSSEFQKFLSEHLKACSYRSLVNSGVPLDGLVAMARRNIQGISEYVVNHLKAQRQVVASDELAVVSYLSLSLDAKDFVNRINHLA